METIVRASGFRRLVAIGDLHGAPEALAAALVIGGVCERTESDQMAWTAEPGTCLVFLGDYLDGNRSESDLWRVLRALALLESEAAQHGSRVIALLGNHETDFFGGFWQWGRRDSLAGSFGLPIQAEGVRMWCRTIRTDTKFLRSHEALATPVAMASWLCARPLVASVGPFVLLHGGPTVFWEEQLQTFGDAERTIAAIEERWGLYHPLFGTSRESILAACDPLDRQLPVFAHSLAMRKRFRNALGGGDVLVVGHNAFLPALDDLIPLDTGIKRGGRNMRVLVADLERQTFEVRERPFGARPA